jgi:AcrR family transcriptional regulator
MAKTNPKDRILETASRLFFNQGYNTTGINQILDEAKVAKASLYTHYGSKEDLGIAYLKATRQEWFKTLHIFLTNKESSTKKILGAFDFLELNLKQNGFRGCRFINLRAEISDENHQMKKEIAGHKANLRSFFRDLVSEIIKTKSKADQLADSILLLFEGAIVESKIHGDVWPIKSARKTAELLLNM